LWKHSLAVALGSKIVSEKEHPEAINELLTASLIHDIGKMVLYTNVCSNLGHGRSDKP
jgi:HD-GYP domain-containing protein (c-di-GMP phosphodiesterase class II)